jgi:hypothetical protein
MDPPMPDERDILVAKSKSALMHIAVRHLMQFCSNHGLVVHSTGRKRAIKVDYATAIFIYVRSSLQPDIDITNILHS